MILKILKSEMRPHPAYFSPQQSYLVEIILPITTLKVDKTEDELAMELGRAFIKSIKENNHQRI